MTRISLLAGRSKGVLWDAEEREYLTLQVREWHVEDLHGTRAFDQLVALREAEQPQDLFGGRALALTLLGVQGEFIDVLARHGKT